MTRIIFWIIISISTWYSVASKNVYDEVHYKKVENVFNYDYFDDGNTCSITTNQNETFQFGENIEKPPLPNWLEEEYCEFDITLNINHTGRWIFGNGTTTVDREIYIFVHEKLLSYGEEIDRGKISASLNATILQWIPSDLMNFTSCYFIRQIEKDGNEHKYVVYDLYHTDEKDIKLFEKCGVRLKVTPDNEGAHTLYAINGNGSAILSEFELRVNTDVNVSKIKFVNETVRRGTEKHIISHGSVYDTTKYCTITDPHDNLIIIENDSCMHQISLVTSYHQGIWILRKFDTDQNEVFDYQYNLTVSDDIIRMKVDVNFNKDNFTILCNTTGQHIVKTCKFVNPSAVYITMALGTFTEKYEYYGESFGESYHDQECGIVVHNVSKSDYGTWKCIMTTDNDEIIDSLIHVHDEIKIFSENSVVHVTEHSPFVIRCSANRRLSYCWLRSPNGTIYSVLKENSNLNTLEYDGQGLYKGECGVKVSNASTLYDHGVWSCHMGIENGPDLQTPVNVKVFDSPVAALEDKIEVSSGDRITLSVVATSGEEFDENNCQWISPAGAIILRNYDNNYVVTNTKSSCTLEIGGVNEHEHLGQWVCIIFYGDEKIQTFIEVITQSYYNWWIFLIVGILAIIVLTIAFYFIIKMAKNVLYKDHLLSNTSNVTTDDPPYISRTQI